MATLRRPAGRFLTHSTSVGATGTEVLFPKWIIALKVVSEQFWGRAARASNDSQESGRLLIFAGKSSSPGSALSVFSTRLLRDLCASAFSQICANRENPWPGFFLIRRNRKVHRDPRFCLYRLTLLEIGLEMPLFHCLPRRGGQNGGSTDHLQLLYASVLINQRLKHHRALYLHLLGQQRITRFHRARHSRGGIRGQTYLRVRVAVWAPCRNLTSAQSRGGGLHFHLDGVARGRKRPMLVPGHYLHVQRGQHGAVGGRNHRARRGTLYGGCAWRHRSLLSGMRNSSGGSSVRRHNVRRGQRWNWAGRGRRSIQIVGFRLMARGGREPQLAVLNENDDYCLQ